MWVVKQNYNEKYLNPTNTRLDAKIVDDVSKAHRFSTKIEAVEFLYTTTFFDKGYNAVQV